MRASTRKYGDSVVQMVENRGGKVLWMGRADQILIGDPAEGWDSVALVEYPSRKAFIEMVTDAGVREGARAPRVGPRTHGAHRVHERACRFV